MTKAAVVVLTLLGATLLHAGTIPITTCGQVVGPGQTGIPMLRRRSPNAPGRRRSGQHATLGIAPAAMTRDGAGRRVPGVRRSEGITGETLVASGGLW
jgi:hypothetical protein